MCQYFDEIDFLHLDEPKNSIYVNIESQTIFKKDIKHQEAEKIKENIEQFKQEYIQVRRKYICTQIEHTPLTNYEDMAIALTTKYNIDKEDLLK